MFNKGIKVFYGTKLIFSPEQSIGENVIFPQRVKTNKNIKIYYDIIIL